MFNKAFHEHYYSMICTDDTLFKDKYHRIFFIVIAKDCNNQIYLLTFDIGDKKAGVCMI